MSASDDDAGSADDDITAPALTVEAVAEVRERMWRAGFAPVPIFSHDVTHDRAGNPIPSKSRGKRPVSGGWRTAAAPGRVEADAMNTGLLCDGLRAVDIDCDDPKVAERIAALALDRLGTTPIRCRHNTSRTLLLFRAAAGSPGKLKVTGTRQRGPDHPDGAFAEAMEVLGAGQQVVVHGVHRSGAELGWAPATPWEMGHLHNLTPITEEALASFLDAVRAIIGDASRKPLVVVEVTKPVEKPITTPPASSISADVFSDVAGDLNGWIRETLNPEVFKQLDMVFPEFRWRRNSRGWVAQNWPPLFLPGGVDNREASRIITGSEKPYGLGLHGRPGEGWTWVQLAAGDRHVRGPEAMAAIHRLAEKVNLQVPNFRTPRHHHTPATSLPSTMPPGFSMDHNGLCWQPPQKGEGETPEPVWIAAPHTVVANVAAPDGSGPGLLISWQHGSHIIPRADLHGEARTLASRLEDAGLRCASHVAAHTALRTYLSRVEPGHARLLVERTGWARDACGRSGYVFGDGTTAGTADVTLRPSCVERGPATETAGTLAEWQDTLARFATGNSRLAFALSMSLAGPLLDITGDESGGVNLFGDSKTGKSTLASAAGSVWGRGDTRGQVRSWRSTANATEALAARSTDAILVLDELGSGNARELGDIIYSLANDAGKARLSRDGSARAVRTWRVLLISTGEETAGARMAAAGVVERAGQAVRLISLPADAGAGYGVWETLHGHTPAGLSEHVRDAARTHYGTAARAWVEVLAELRTHDDDALREVVVGHMNAFLREHVPEAAGGQVRVVARRFALVAAAGEIASAADILPWPEGEAMRAAGTCYQAWLATRGNVGAGEDARAVAAVRRFVVEHGAARFAEVDACNLENASSERIIRQAGWREEVKVTLDDGSTGLAWCYWIDPDIWAREVCEGMDPGRVARALRDAGHLDHEGKHLTKKKRLPGGLRSRYYVVLPNIFEEDTE